MKFKITEIDTYKMKVEYSDGSWALIPSEKGKDKAWYSQRILDFCATPEVEEPEVQYYTASDLREFCYPAENQQFEAIYDARTGDNTLLTAVDAHIKFVKDSIALDSTKYTMEQMKAKLEELKKDSKFVTHGL